jgi:DNA-binding response OmpR family regulator
MIVDDEADILLVLQKGLENNGFKVAAFSDPVDALEHFTMNQDHIDLVITDARMPVMSGFQLVREIKKLRESVPLIMISAFEIHKSEFDRVLPSTHIDGFMTKPFHLSEVMKVVETLV